MNDFLPFLQKSPTVFHAAEEIVHQLKKKGFVSLDETTRWNLHPGKGYFVLRGGSLLAAFRMPKKEIVSATILATHIDSPGLKLKPRPHLATQQISQFGTEVYGAPLLHTWLDRDLVVSGRLDGKLVHFEDHPLIIPSLALHLDRTITEKGLLVHKQDHLKPIVSLQADHTLAKKIQSATYFDLFLTPLEKPALIGHKKELLASYRLDNLTSAYAALQGLLHAPAQENVLQMALFWDHEEIGSMSYVGADSSFADQLLERIFKKDREDFFCMKSRSRCLSLDVAHGFHPNFADKFDPQNQIFLGKGVAIKHNANQKYASHAETLSWVTEWAKREKIALQSFAGRSDIPSGSTVGSMLASHLGIPTLDVGIATWAMHSIRETIAVQDEQSLIDFCTGALEAEGLALH